jgi:hypothetical protein
MRLIVVEFFFHQDHVSTIDDVLLFCRVNVVTIGMRQRSARHGVFVFPGTC